MLARLLHAIDKSQLTPFLANAYNGNRISIEEALKDSPDALIETNAKRESALYLAAAGKHKSLEQFLFLRGSEYLNKNIVEKNWLNAAKYNVLLAYYHRRCTGSGSAAVQACKEAITYFNNVILTEKTPEIYRELAHAHQYCSYSHHKLLQVYKNNKEYHVAITEAEGSIKAMEEAIATLNYLRTHYHWNNEDNNTLVQYKKYLFDALCRHAETFRDHGDFYSDKDGNGWVSAQNEYRKSGEVYELALIHLEQFVAENDTYTVDKFKTLLALASGEFLIADAYYHISKLQPRKFEWVPVVDNKSAEDAQKNREKLSEWTLAFNACHSSIEHNEKSREILDSIPTKHQDLCWQQSGINLKKALARSFGLYAELFANAQEPDWHQSESYYQQAYNLFNDPNMDIMPDDERDKEIFSMRMRLSKANQPHTSPAKLKSSVSPKAEHSAFFKSNSMTALQLLQELHGTEILSPPESKR